MTLSDGKTLAFDTYGGPDGTPVIFSHGEAAIDYSWKPGDVKKI